MIVRNPRLYSCALLLLLLLLAACRPAPQSAAPTPAPALAPAASSVAATPGPDGGELNPDTVKDFPALEIERFDGKHWSLAGQRGKWVVLNFWATWCTPCLKEIPDLDAFDKARDDVEVLGLAYEEIERPDMEAFLKQHAFSYPVALVDVYKGLPDFPIPKGLPMTYVVAPDGKVAKQFLGPVDMPALQKLVGPPAKAPAP
jgi:thiol-disulfide isomerase/thioredoxin